MKRIELLSPAGDLERLYVTLLYGADAVYIGGKEFSLRANAVNFSIEDIKKGCSFAHKLNKKVYLTLNMVFHNNDYLNVYKYIKDVVDAGIDAFIISDLYLANYIKKNHKNVEVHISTQLSTTNYLTVEYFKNNNIDRVVLARELSIDEIKEIIDKTNMDIEVFLHGAMCTSISGRCALSKYVTNRDANRGGCSQVCRFSFKNNNLKDFTMASCDLNLSKYINELIDAKVTSLKVEGRMRSLYYLATVISSYRMLIDDYYENKLSDDEKNKIYKRLESVSNRKSTIQFFKGNISENDQYYTGRQELSNQEFLGLITGYDEINKQIVMLERNYFKKGDLVEIFTPSGKIYNMRIDNIINSKDEIVDVANHPDEELKIPFDYKIEAYSMMRKIEDK